MFNLCLIMFIIGLVLFKLVLFMYVLILVVFFIGSGGFFDFV